MKPGGGKRKGASFERKICRDLSEWVTEGKRQDCFWRSAMSGGRATVGLKSGKLHVRQAGDITSVSQEGHPLTNIFYIECKHVRDLHIDKFILKRGQLFKFWNVAKREAKKYDRIPMLIARQNGWPILLCTSPQGTERLQLLNNLRAVLVGTDVFLFSDVLKTKFNLST